MITITIDEDVPVSDPELENLLIESYVGGGFTEPTVAAELFAAGAVRARGSVLLARDRSGVLVGTVTLVRGGSAASRLARAGEAELHLLCVRATARGRGIGRQLVQAVLDRAARESARRVVLWTQPAMVAAQRLYEQAGFRRAPARDFSRAGREFLVFERDLGGQ